MLAQTWGRIAHVAHPSGTVTFLFSDVEGSTSMWERAPEVMAVAIERHEDLIRRAALAEAGYVFKTVGDAFCVAFSAGGPAARAAIEAQLALVAEPWPDETPIRVRMALHTGECQERNDDYFGPTVNRVARLLAVAHGGQVVASGTTASLLGDVDGLSLVDLGAHRLRDLGRPEQVFQLTFGTLPSTFPPLRSLDDPDLPNNLPALLSPFLGRERELDEVRTLVRESRLVTLTGAGGAGKTRLAVQTAAEVLDGAGDGVWLVELAPLTDESQVVPAIAAAYGLQDALDDDPLETLLRSLSAQRSLLVLDNCEHLVDRVAKVADAVLRSCPEVHVLATSREPLGVDGERVYRVPSMSLPSVEVERLVDATASDAVALFVGRAGDVGVRIDDGDGQLVASVCRRLDGIPLALELAAARLTSMSLQQLSDRLDQRFRLLTGGARSAMARQQTLQALVDWSYELLNPAERVVLQRLSVFTGGFELEAAEFVCAGGEVDELDVLNLVHSLVEKSLVVADQDAGTVRYRLLETIRQYAATELLRAAGDGGVTDVRDRHAAYCCELGARAEVPLRGADQAAWLARLDLEVDNLRASVAHMADRPDRARDLLRLVIDVERFVVSRGLVELLPPAQASLASLEDDELVARGATTIAVAIGLLHVNDRAQMQVAGTLARRGLELASRLGLITLEAVTTAYLAMLSQYHGDVEASKELMTRALALSEACGDGLVRAQVLTWAASGRIVQALGLTMEQRRDMALEVQRLARQLHDQRVASVACALLGTLHHEEGDLEAAGELYEESIALGEALGGEEALKATRGNLLITTLVLGRYDEVRPQLRRCIRLVRLTGFRTQAGDLVFTGAVLATVDGDMVRGARLHGAADELRRDAYETGEMVKSPGEALQESESVARAVAELGEERYRDEYERGRLLTAAEACDLVLGRAPRE